MAEEKKPKIDLKARLKKDAGTPAPPPTSPGALDAASAPVIPPPAVSSTPGMSGPGIPIPPGVPVGGTPAALDPSNPLAIAAGTAAPKYSAPPQPQRIEVDETEVREAASKARRSGLMIGLGVALLFAGAGFAVGDASATSAGRQQAKRDAADLKKNVDAAKAKLEDIAKALEEGKTAISAKPGERKFPADLANKLGGMKVDFDGQQLAGRRFSGFSTEATSGLVDFITGVQSMEENKNAVKGVLTKLGANKAFVEQFNAPPGAGGQAEYVVLLGGPTGKDPKGNYLGMITRLSTPLALSAQGGLTGDMPKDLQAVNPLASGNISVTPYKSGDLSNPSAVYVLPKSFESVCPSDTKSAAGQLGIKLQDLIKQIRGEGKPAAGNDLEQDTKPGLLERAETLSKQLEKI